VKQNVAPKDKKNYNKINEKFDDISSADEKK
jgi:hypothetical protein